MEVYDMGYFVDFSGDGLTDYVCSVEVKGDPDHGTKIVSAAYKNTGSGWQLQP